MLRDPTELLWKRPGTLPPRVVVVVALACVLVIVAALVGPHMLWTHTNCRGACYVMEACDDCTGGFKIEHIDRWSLLYGLAIGLAAWIAVSFVPPFRWSRWLRVTVLLPGVPLIVLAVVWERWPVLAPMLPGLDDAPLVDALPIGWVLIAALAWSAAAGWLAARRRGREWLHASVMIALVDLLLVGLWLPIAASLRWAMVDHHYAWAVPRADLLAPKT